MCQYRYCYFTACRHAHTVLSDFCENALPLAPVASAAAGVTPDDSERGKQHQSDGAPDGMGGAADVKHGGPQHLLLHDAASPSSPHSRPTSPLLPPSHHPPPLHSPTAAVSFDLPTVPPTASFITTSTEQSASDCTSSLSSEHRLVHSSAPATATAATTTSPATDAMSGLALFPGGTFRQWMAGSAIPSLQVDRVSVNKDQHCVSSCPPPSPPGRLRQSGIRERTDESCDLPKSDDIMRHLAESHRPRGSRCGDTDTASVISYRCSTNTSYVDDNFPPRGHAYDAIEADIDTLKEEVIRLRKQDKVRTAAPAPKTVEESVLDQSLTTGRGGGHDRSVQEEPVRGSAAARLQRQHELLAEERARQASEQPKSPSPVPPGPTEFPALAASASISTGTTRKTPEAPRKLSYALAAASATSKTPTRTIETHSPQTVENDGGSVGVTTPDALKIESSSQGSVSPSKSKPTTPNSKNTKANLRFAQPTESFARRAGATVRKDSAVSPPRLATNGSPTKSVKGKDATLAGGRQAAQHHQKRKSIPCDWLNDSPRSPDHAGPEQTAIQVGASTATAEIVSSPVSLSSPSSIEGPNSIHRGNTKENTATIKARAAETKHEPLARRKKSSYMAPTEAATRRSIATLGQTQENIKRIMPQVRPSNLQIDTERANQHTPSSAASEAGTSDTSSVQFILESSETDSVVSPTRKIPGGWNDGEKEYQSTLHETSVSSARTDAASSVGEGTSTKSPFSTSSKESSAQPRIFRSPPRDSQQHRAESFADVANVTTKRRVSYGPLMKPIAARLDRAGLLNQNLNNSVIQCYLEDLTKDSLNGHNQTDFAKFPEDPHRASLTASDASHRAGNQVPVKKAVPPRLERPRDVSVETSSSGATLCPTMALPSRSDSPRNASIASFSQGDGSHVSVSSPLAGPRSSVAPLVSKPSRSASLRATAEEFQPMWKPQTPAEQLRQLSWSGALDYRSDDEWSKIPPEVRQSIVMLRDFKNGCSWSPSSAIAPNRVSPTAPPSKGAERRFWGHLMNGAPTENHPPPTGPRQFPLPSKFGRAPPPHFPPTPQTPSMSPTSDDTSSPSVRGWSIGSTRSAAPYGWSGGDGQEIRFVGYGVYAERDPNCAVDFRFGGGTALFGGDGGNGAGGRRRFRHHSSSPPTDGTGASDSTSSGFSPPGTHDNDNDDDRRPVAPRSMRQWAEKAGYHRVPCGHVQVVHAVEQVPFASQSVGYCHDCVGGNR